MSVISSIPAPTPEQIAIVKSTAPVLEEHGVTITTQFYKNIHEAVPALHGIFNQTNQKNGHQPRALAMSVLAYAKYIDNLSVLSDAVELICQKHVSFLIQPDQYNLVGEYLLGAIKQVLGDAATEDIMSAWEAAYWQLAHIMIAREEQLYSEKTSRDWRSFVVEKKVRESEEVTSFYLKPKDGKPVDHYKPGQFLSIRVDVPQQKWKQIRQYSISTSSDPATYRISVKRIDGIDTKDASLHAHPGWVSNVLHDSVQEGDEVEVTFPCGTFYLDPKKTPNAPVVLISGGVGLTPVMAMLDTLVDQGSNRPLTWIHSTRSQKAYAFGDHVKAVMKTKENWHAIVYNGNGDIAGDDTNYQVIGGKIDLQSLERDQDLHLNDPDTQYFICGPDSFMLELNEKLISLGAVKENVKYEKFGTGDLIKEEKKATQGCPFSERKDGNQAGMKCPVTGAMGDS